MSNIENLRKWQKKQKESQGVGVCTPKPSSSSPAVENNVWENLNARREDVWMKHLQKIPDSLRNTFNRSSKMRASAIKAKCCDCMAFEDYRTRISDCRTFICPLWPHRPYQNKTKGEN